MGKENKKPRIIAREQLKGKKQIKFQ